MGNCGDLPKSDTCNEAQRWTKTAPTLSDIASTGKSSRLPATPREALTIDLTRPLIVFSRDAIAQRGGKFPSQVPPGMLEKAGDGSRIPVQRLLLDRLDDLDDL